MPVLAKITPDYLRDTIVEIRYEAKLPYDLLKGLLFKEFKEDFQLLSSINPLGVLQLGPRQQLKLGRNEELDFSDNEIKIQIHDGRIVFNSLDAYPGWKRYFPKIQAILEKLNKTDYIDQFQRVGIRYISEFPEMLIFDKLKLNLNFTFKEASFYNTTIRTEFVEEGARVVLNLANNMKKRSPGQNSFFSIIDIDVIGEVPNDTDLKGVFSLIDHLHSVEKSTFQNLLKKEFLDTLNPEFE